MKPDTQSWSEYLRAGVQFLEGTHPDLGIASTNWFAQAKRTFEECAFQEDNLAVQLEAYFHRARYARYAEGRNQAREWLTRGRERRELLRGRLSAAAAAQSYVLEGIVLADLGDFPGALAATRAAWHLEPEDLTLCGNIANRLGQLYAEHGSALGLSRRKRKQNARDAYEQATRSFEQIDPPTGDALHALAVASGRAGIAAQWWEGYRSRRAFQHFARAESLFGRAVHEPRACAAYWFNRARVALRYGRPQALWFFLRCLGPALACLRQHWHR